LNRITAADLSGSPGRAIYTQLLNDRGGIEGDLTILHRGEDDFLIVTGSGFGVRDANWIGRQLPPGLALRDVTNALAVINICGPLSREVLASVTEADLSNAGFPFLAAREITVGMAPAFAVRIGYVGELGWELYIPVEYAGHVYEMLKAAGQGHGIRDAGYRAIESCRLEKGYLYWSADITPDTTPFEAGLGFAVAMDKGEFMGCEALRDAPPPQRKLATLSVEGFAPFLGGETVLYDGRPIASLTSAGFGHHLGRSIGFAYLPAELGSETHLTIEAFGKSFSAIRGARCLYDPKMTRLKA
jgi:4-methylaminobutanoate oxidase (formaldehyde-forming)